MVLFAASRLRSEITPPVSAVTPEPPPVPIARIMMPPPSVLRPGPPGPPARVEATPRPVPTPEPEAKDRVSIGGPSPIRQKTPLVLKRDEDLTRAVAKGRPEAPETPTPTPAIPSPAPTPQVARATPAPSAPPAESTPDAEPAPAAEPSPAAVAEAADLPLAPPSPAAPPSSGEAPSIAGSLRNLEERLAVDGIRGVQTGTGQQMGEFFFDPKGADFTAWTNHLKNDVYRNWIVPPSVRMGIRGHVEIEFRVDRDGTMSAIRVVRSSGTPALDRAAQNALLGSRPLPLPSDYRPTQLAMQVTFFYNEAGS